MRGRPGTRLAANRTARETDIHIVAVHCRAQILLHAHVLKRISLHGCRQANGTGAHWPQCQSECMRKFPSINFPAAVENQFCIDESLRLRFQVFRPEWLPTGIRGCIRQTPVVVNVRRLYRFRTLGLTVRLIAYASRTVVFRTVGMAISISVQPPPNHSTPQG
jgi:hypothetical protein